MRDAATQEALRSIASDTVTTSYADLGGVFTGNILSISVINGSDKAMVISLDDGTTDHFYLPPQSSEQISFGDFDHAIPAGSQPQVKLLAAGAATAGTLVAIHATVSKSLGI